MKQKADALLDAMSGIRPEYIEAAAEPDSSRQAQRGFRYWRLAAACLLGIAVIAAVPVLHEAVRRQTESGNTQSEPLYYPTAMQEYFTAVNGHPCSMDLTGMGKDLSIEFDNNDSYAGDHHIRLRAIAGDAFRLFLFADVTEPVQTEDPIPLGTGGYGLSVLTNLSGAGWLHTELSELRVLSEEQDGEKITHHYCMVCTPPYGTNFAGGEVKVSTCFEPIISSRIGHTVQSEPIRIDFAAEPVFVPLENEFSVGRGADLPEEIADSMGVTPGQTGGDLVIGCAAVTPFGIQFQRYLPEEFDIDEWLAALNVSEPRASRVSWYVPERHEEYGTVYETPAPVLIELLAYDREGNSSAVQPAQKHSEKTIPVTQLYDPDQTLMLVEFAEPYDFSDTEYIEMNTDSPGVSGIKIKPAVPEP